MPFMEWCDEIRTGVEIIDLEHREMLERLNRLYDCVQNGCGTSVLGQTLDEMVSYIVGHFQHEEEYMLATNYNGFAAHKTEHTQMAAQLMQIYAHAQEGLTDHVANELLAFLKSWAMGHILYCDKALAAHLRACGAA